MKPFPTALEGIISKHLPAVPFLVYRQVKKLIVDVCKRRVSKTLKINKLKEQQAELKSSLTTFVLPERFKPRYQKLLKADFDPETLKSGVIFVLNLELGNIASSIANVEAEVALFSSEFVSILDKFLEFAKFAPRPSSGEQWDVFRSLYFDSLIDAIEAHFYMGFYSVQLVHDKKKSLKEQKLNQLRLQKQQPLVLTEEALEKKFRELLVSKPTNNTSNVPLGRPKPNKKPGARPAAKKNGNQGKGQHPPKSQGDAQPGRRADQANKGKTASRKRRS